MTTAISCEISARLLVSTKPIVLDLCQSAWDAFILAHFKLGGFKSEVALLNKSDLRRVSL
ncbi:hypothetical protein MZ16F88_46830 [Escherichia coli]|nr:hypothetical protein VEE58_34000 [Escherichia coli]